MSSQIEEGPKNDEGHVASLKSAKTSYFKAGFRSIKQFKNFKSASSQLIAK
jgi:hypothetical protein